MIVRFGPWNKEKVVSLNIIISFIWLLSVTIIFPFYQVVWKEALSKDETLIVVPQNSNLIEIFDATPQLYVGCFFTPRFNCHIYPSQLLQQILSQLSSRLLQLPGDRSPGQVSNIIVG